MLHPYPRQSLFGPKIDGVPWCVWENEIRRAATPRTSKSWLLTVLEKTGFLAPPRLIDGPELLPIYLQLIDDDDRNVRRFLVRQLERRDLKPEFWRWSDEDEAKILPIMRRRLNDDDPICRLGAAEYIWRATKDREMIQVPLAHLNHPDPWIQRGAAIVLCYLAEADLDVAFDPIVKLVDDPTRKKDVRTTAIQSMRHFGKRGVPILQKGLRNPEQEIRLSAMWAAREMAKEAKDLVPILVEMRNDADPTIRRMAAITLGKIAP